MADVRTFDQLREQLKARVRLYIRTFAGTRRLRLFGDWAGRFRELDCGVDYFVDRALVGYAGETETAVLALLPDADEQGQIIEYGDLVEMKLTELSLGVLERLATALDTGVEIGPGGSWDPDEPSDEEE